MRDTLYEIPAFVYPQYLMYHTFRLYIEPVQASDETHIQYERSLSGPKLSGHAISCSGGAAIF